MSQKLIEMLSFEGQSAVVTGGGKGIGRGIAERLAEGGAGVLIADVDEESGIEAVRAIEKGGGRARFQLCDTSKPADARRAVDEAAKAFGRLGVLVNNAGVFPTRGALDVDEALWDRVLDINLKGAFFFAQAAAKKMIEAGRGGAIVNIASIDAFKPTGSLVAYDSSKGGMAMMTKSLAFELAKHGIRVNAVAPGGIHTPGASESMQAMNAAAPAGFDMEKAFAARIPLGRMGEPDDIARTVAFLASPLAAYVTGATLIVDGGYLLA